MVFSTLIIIDLKFLAWSFVSLKVFFLYFSLIIDRITINHILFPLCWSIFTRMNSTS